MWWPGKYLAKGLKNVARWVGTNIAEGWDHLTGKKQYGLGRDVFEYQKDAQETTWQREDTEIQRRVADLRAAGLSPTLAAGQGASTSAPVKPQTPEAGQGSFGAMLQAAQVGAEIRDRIAHIGYTKAQEKYVEAQTQRQKIENKHLGDQFTANIESTLVSTAINQALGPHRIDSQRLSNEGQRIQNQFNQVNNPELVRRLRTEITNIDAGIYLRRQQADLNRLDIHGKTIQNMTAELQRENQVLQNDHDRARLIAQEIAISISEAEQARLEHNNQWYTDNGLPIGTPITPEVIAVTILNRIRQASSGNVDEQLRDPNNPQRDQHGDEVFDRALREWQLRTGRTQ